LPWRFTPGAAVAKETPSGPVRMDLGKATSFVIAAIPLHEIRFDLGNLSKSSQLTGPHHSLERTRKDRAEFEAFEEFPEAAGITLPARI